MTSTSVGSVAILWSAISVSLAGARTVAADREAPKAPTTQLSPADDQAVRAIVAAYETAWNTHDMNAMSKLFTPDAEFINKVGMHWKGRDEIMVAHTAFHQTTFKNHSYRTDAVETRGIAPGIAIAVVTETFNEFSAPDGRVFPKSLNRLTYVLVKGPDGWRITHGQNVVVDELATKHNPVQSKRD